MLISIQRVRTGIVILIAHTHTHTHPHTLSHTHTQSPGLGTNAIIAIGASVGGIVVILIAAALFACCCYCLCKTSKTAEYEVRPYGVVVRKWDPRTSHQVERSGSLISNRSRNSMARSSISSVGSFLRASIRRLSGKRRSGRKSNLLEEPITMKVTPL